MKHGFIKNWDEFWDIYISNVKGEIGDDFEKLKNNPPQGTDTISKSLKWMSDTLLSITITSILKKMVQSACKGCTVLLSDIISSWKGS